MVIYIINGYFLDNAGFSKRCQREIEILTQHESVILISRDKRTNFKKNKLTFINFSVPESLVENPKNYTNGLYEIYRNVKLFFPLMRTVLLTLRKYNNERLTVYVVASPMTLPFFYLLLIKLFKISH